MSLVFSLLFFLILAALYALARPFFMLYTGALGQGAVWTDFLDVVVHGLPLDLCVAAILALPVLTASYIGGIASRLRAQHSRLQRPPRQATSQGIALRLLTAYLLVVAIVSAIVLVSDAALYPFWDIKLDATVLAYLDSPRGALNSVSSAFLCGYAAAVVSIAALFFLPLRSLARRMLRPAASLSGGSPAAAGFFVGGGLLAFVALALCIRGIERLWAAPSEDEPISVATAYYSTRQVFNHAAVNPLFSFFSSVGTAARGISPDTFMPPAEADSLFAAQNYNVRSEILPADSLLSPGCRQIVLIVMEGCGGTLVGGVCGKTPEITPCLNRLCDEGVFFERCYANSFRTDRGLVSLLSGYPAFPDLSVMRHAERCAALPGIAASLRRAGYRTEFLYGGDRDFTRMADYLLQTGYERVWGDRDFPAEVRHTHEWGVTDHLTFQQLARLTTAPLPEAAKRFITFLTLSSHEPWEVPYERLLKKGKIANSFAYLDHCVASYLAALRRSPLWKETLVILVADHGIAWPDAISETRPDRYHIPLLWTGGAVRRPRRIPALCNQTDLAATLLGQLGIPHSDFRFSRNVTSQSYTVHCAQHSWAEGFTFIDSTGFTVTDLHTLSAIASYSADSTDAASTRRRAAAAKAFLQTAYGDYASLGKH